MINKLYILIFIIFLNFSFIGKVTAEDQFNFDITEIEILENGNLFKGIKRGTISANNGIVIDADYFENK